MSAPSSTRTPRSSASPPFTPATLALTAIPGWTFPAHLRRLERATLTLLHSRTARNLLLSLPVRHGKSEYTCVALAAWYLSLFPHRRVMMATHSHSLSSEFGGRVRAILAEHGGRLTGVRLARLGARDDWKTEAGGGLFCTSPGASCAGRGYDLGIADDLVKDFAKAASPSARRALSVWFHGEFLSRRQPDARTIMIQSRRHPADLAGELEAAGPELPPQERWQVIRQPALDDQGNALWPEQWPAERLEQVRAQYEQAGLSYLWGSLYQQDPTADSTALEWPSEWLADKLLYDELPPSLQPRLRVLALDPSKGKRSSAGDFSAWCDVILDQQGTLWVTPTLLRVPTTQVEDQAVEMLRQARYDAVGVEVTGFQEVLASNIAIKAERQGLHCPLWPIESTEDKVVRIRIDLTSLLARGRVRVNARSPHARLFLAQMREFPTGAHDDGPDSLSMATRAINRLLRGQPQQPRRHTV